MPVSGSLRTQRLSLPADVSLFLLPSSAVTQADYVERKWLLFTRRVTYEPLCPVRAEQIKSLDAHVLPELGESCCDDAVEWNYLANLRRTGSIRTGKRRSVIFF